MFEIKGYESPIDLVKLRAAKELGGGKFSGNKYQECAYNILLTNLLFTDNDEFEETRKLLHNYWFGEFLRNDSISDDTIFILNDKDEIVGKIVNLAIPVMKEIIDNAS